jgi:hypothetical protein
MISNRVTKKLHNYLFNHYRDIFERGKTLLKYDDKTINSFERDCRNEFENVAFVYNNLSYDVRSFVESSDFVNFIPLFNEKVYEISKTISISTPGILPPVKIEDDIYRSLDAVYLVIYKGALFHFLKKWNKMNDPKQFELMPFIHDLVRYFICEAQFIYIISESITHVENNNQGVKANINMLIESTQDYLSTLRIDIFKDFIIKIDATSSGLQQLGLLLEDNNNINLLEFSSIKTSNKTLVGYDLILDIVSRNYEKGMYPNLKQNIQCIPVNYQELVKTNLLSRKTIKSLVMVIGYSGTEYGQVNNVFDNLYSMLRVNGFVVQPLDYLLIKDIIKTIVEIINNIIKTDYKILVYYINLTKRIARLTAKDGVVIKSKNLKTILAPKLRLFHTVKINIINKTTKKEVRDKRRKVSYFGREIDVHKMENTLAPRLAHIMDSIILYYFKLFFNIIKPSNNIISIHDCFMYSQVSTKQVKNILRLAYYAAFKENLLQQIIITNNLENVIPFAPLDNDEDYDTRPIKATPIKDTNIITEINTLKSNLISNNIRIKDMIRNQNEEKVLKTSYYQDSSLHKVVGIITLKKDNIDIKARISQLKEDIKNNKINIKLEIKQENQRKSKLQIPFEYRNIFKDISDNTIDNLIQSERLKYLLWHRYDIIDKYNQFNSDLFKKAFSTYHETKYEASLIAEASNKLPGQSNEKIEALVYINLLQSLEERMHNFINLIDDPLCVSLNIIINNDNFFK